MERIIEHLEEGPDEGPCEAPVALRHAAALSSHFKADPASFHRQSSHFPWWFLHDRPVNEGWDFQDGNPPEATKRCFDCLAIFKEALATEEAKMPRKQKGMELSELVKWSELQELCGFTCSCLVDSSTHLVSYACSYGNAWVLSGGTNVSMIWKLDRK